MRTPALAPQTQIPRTVKPPQRAEFHEARAIHITGVAKPTRDEKCEREHNAASDDRADP